MSEGNMTPEQTCKCGHSDDKHESGVCYGKPDCSCDCAWPATPEQLKDYWRCFHCDFATSVREEAEAHFGDRDNPDECKPICKWWTMMGEDERVATLQDTIQQLNCERKSTLLEAAEIAIAHGKTIGESCWNHENRFTGEVAGAEFTCSTEIADTLRKIAKEIN